MNNIFAKNRYMRPYDQNLTFTKCIEKFTDNNEETLASVKRLSENFVKICKILQEQEWVYKSEEQCEKFIDSVIHFQFCLLWFSFRWHQKSKNPASQHFTKYDDLAQIIYEELEEGINFTSVTLEKSSSDVKEDFRQLRMFFMRLVEKDPHNGIMQVISNFMRSEKPSLLRLMGMVSTIKISSSYYENPIHIQETIDYINHSKTFTLQHYDEIQRSIIAPETSLLKSKMASFFYLFNLMCISYTFLRKGAFLGMSAESWSGDLNAVSSIDFLSYFQILFSRPAGNEFQTMLREMGYGVIASYDQLLPFIPPLTRSQSVESFDLPSPGSDFAFSFPDQSFNVLSPQRPQHKRRVLPQSPVKPSFKPPKSARSVSPTYVSSGYESTGDGFDL